eukprot:7659336-Alexandrium_andersonii.AAC.1
MRSAWAIVGATPSGAASERACRACCTSVHAWSTRYSSWAMTLRKRPRLPGLYATAGLAALLAFSPWR